MEYICDILLLRNIMLNVLGKEKYGRDYCKTENISQQWIRFFTCLLEQSILCQSMAVIDINVV